MKNVHELTMERLRMFSMKVVVDESVPPGELRVCQDNRIVARVVNIDTSPKASEPDEA